MEIRAKPDTDSHVNEPGGLNVMAKRLRTAGNSETGWVLLSPNYLRKDQLLLDAVAFGLLRSPR